MPISPFDLGQFGLSRIVCQLWSVVIWFEGTANEKIVKLKENATDMATGPKLPTDALEILTPDLTREEPYINKYWGGTMTAVLLASCYALTNYSYRRPVFSGLHWYALNIGGGWFVGQYFDQKRKEYFAEKDAVLRHYVQLHPEDFPPIERKKFGDVLLPWQPIR